MEKDEAEKKKISERICDSLPSEQENSCGVEMSEKEKTEDEEGGKKREKKSTRVSEDKTVSHSPYSRGLIYSKTTSVEWPNRKKRELIRRSRHGAGMTLL